MEKDLLLIEGLKQAELPLAWKELRKQKERKGRKSQRHYISHSPNGQFTLVGKSKKGRDHWTQHWDFKLINHLTHKVRLKLNIELTHRMEDKPIVYWNDTSTMLVFFSGRLLVFSTSFPSQSALTSKGPMAGSIRTRHCTTDISTRSVGSFSFKGNSFVFVSAQCSNRDQGIYECRFTVADQRRCYQATRSRGRRLGSAKVTGNGLTIEKYQVRKVCDIHSFDTRLYTPPDFQAHQNYYHYLLPVSKKDPMTLRRKKSKRKLMSQLQNRIISIMDDKNYWFINLSDISLGARVKSFRGIKANHRCICDVQYSHSGQRFGLKLNDSSVFLVYTFKLVSTLQSRKKISKSVGSVATTMKRSSVELLSEVDFAEICPHFDWDVYQKNTLVRFWSDEILIICSHWKKACKYQFWFYHIDQRQYLRTMELVSYELNPMMDIEEKKEKDEPPSEPDSYFDVFVDYPFQLTLHKYFYETHQSDEIAVLNGKRVFFEHFVLFIKYCFRRCILNSMISRLKLRKKKSERGEDSSDNSSIDIDRVISGKYAWLTPSLLHHWYAYL